ncbi:hypothetical protein [Actinoplanes sandaracinus]|nr:hypothetical protein [Actinoplanes sandaracinus]
MTERVDGSAAAGEQWPMLRDAVKAALGSDPDCFDMAGVWVLADLLESVDPAVTGWNLELAEAAVLLFGEARVGPEDRALAWLRYAQRSASVLAGPLSKQSCTASWALGRLCQRLGNRREAAAAWEVAVLAHERRKQWDEAGEARIEWATCLHRSGSCDEAVAVLRQAWDLPKFGTNYRSPRVPIECISLLLLCGRRDEATALWSEAEARKPTPLAMSWALEMLHADEASGTRARDARAHRQVCAHRGRDVSAPRVPQQRRRVVPLLGVGGCGHG